MNTERDISMSTASQATTQRPTLLTPTVSGVADFSFSPALLLPLPALASAIVCDHDFVDGCAFGYECYVEELPNPLVGESLVYTYTWYTFSQVYALMRNEFPPLPSIPYMAPLPWRAGFVFGWLSALACNQPAYAERGLGFLVALVKKECAHV